MFSIYCIFIKLLYNFLNEVSSLRDSQCQIMKVLVVTAAHYTSPLSKATRNHKSVTYPLRQVINEFCGMGSKGSSSRLSVKSMILGVFYHVLLCLIHFFCQY